MSHASRAAISAAVALLVSLPAVAFAGLDRSSGSTSGSDATSVSTAGSATVWTFSTDQSPFQENVSNQGWWSLDTITRNSNDNYIVGMCCGQQRMRNFFTFDLSRLDGDVVSATLVLRRYTGKGDKEERLRLFDVSTRPRRLNTNRGIIPKIFKDLGRGNRYGTYTVRTREETSRDDVVQLPLNGLALDDIQAAQGDFFSIGGRLVSIRDRGFLFGGSSGHGKQLLIVETRG
jgi:hypothetical protein